MDWFKKNPFLGGIAVAAVVILAVGGYLVSGASGRLSETQAAFDSKKSELENLQRNKPFPDQANVDAAQKETEQAAQLLGDIAKKFEVTVPEITPQEFQDSLSNLVKETIKLAADKGVILPEKFYLGFESYETAPPSAALAPQLGLQLQSIHTVTKILIESQVKSIGPIRRDPLHGEAGAAEATKDDEGSAAKKGAKAAAKTGTAFGMAPFDVSFTSDQSSARTAFNRILDITPPIFVRLAAITNSALKSPSKTGENKSQSEDESTEPSGIKPVFGRETITVNLRLASITGNSGGAN